MKAVFLGKSFIKLCKICLVQKAFRKQYPKEYSSSHKAIKNILVKFKQHGSVVQQVVVAFYFIRHIGNNFVCIIQIFDFGIFLFIQQKHLDCHNHAIYREFRVISREITWYHSWWIVISRDFAWRTVISSSTFFSLFEKKIW